MPKSSAATALGVAAAVAAGVGAGAALFVLASQWLGTRPDVGDKAGRGRGGLVLPQLVVPPPVPEGIAPALDADRYLGDADRDRAVSPVARHESIYADDLGAPSRAASPRPMPSYGASMSTSAGTGLGSSRSAW